jgi:hypothetical protein
MGLVYIRGRGAMSEEATTLCFGLLDQVIIRNVGAISNIPG